MTPPERAAYLIKELGYEKAEEHANWVADGAEKSITKQYWYEVAREITKAEFAAYDKTLKCHCLSCDAPIPEGGGYCDDCNPLPKHDNHKCGDGHFPGIPFTP